MENENGQEEGNMRVFLEEKSQHLQFQGQLLLIFSTFNLGHPDPFAMSVFSFLFPSLSSTQAMNKAQLLTCLLSPPRPKQEITQETIRAQEPRASHSQCLQALAKGCASNIQMTECMPVDLVQVTRKTGMRHFHYSWRA